MAQYGTLSVLDTLAAIRNTTVAQYGEDRTFESVMLALQAHDAIMADMVNELVEFTNDQLRFSGADSSFTAEVLDEFGRPEAQKVSAGDNLGFPFERYGNALQWTRDWLANRTPAELAVQVNAIMDADKRNIIKQIKIAVYNATNVTFKDTLLNQISIPVKRFANADSFPLPPGPDGNSFDSSTHTHYLARAGGSLAESDVTALISTVREHFATGEIVLDINSAQEAAVRAFTDFTPYYDSRLILADTVTRGAATLDVTNIYDRAIGILNGAEVRVKPWTVANYLFAHVMNSGPALAMRTRDGQSAGALELVSDIDMYPLRAQMWRREFGVGVTNRVAGAVLYAGNTTYTSPTL